MNDRGDSVKKMIFLGTGASEMIPNPLCGCRVCREAGKGGDRRDIRCRSAFLFDEHSLIDCGPDVISGCARFGASLENLKRIFLTHSHSDHFSNVTLENLQMCVTEPPKVKIYLSEAAYEGMMRLGRDLSEMSYATYKNEKWIKFCEYIPIEPFREYRDEEITFYAVVGRHPGTFVNENSLNYLLKKDGHTLFYASDTGTYYEETYDFLSGFKLDTLIMECTFGKRDLSVESKHLNASQFLDTVHRLKEMGVVTDETEIYATHIGHKGDLLHTELERILQTRDGSNIHVAYDGLVI